MLDRRKFLKFAAAGTIASILPPEVMGQSSDFWSLPRTLWLKRSATGEEVKATYFADGQVVWPGYKALCILLRDVRANQAVQMDLVLLDILCGVQGVMSASGIQSALYTNSGFRTDETSRYLENAVLGGQHLKAKAWDGGVPGIHTESFSRAGLYLRGGGVGIYHNKNFTHLDSGNIRAWRG